MKPSGLLGYSAVFHIPETSQYLMVNTGKTNQLNEYDFFVNTSSKHGDLSSINYWH